MEKKAAIRIFKSDNNKNCLYYACRDNKCNTFIGWWVAASKFPITGETMEYGSRQRNYSREIADLKGEILSFKKENRRILLQLNEIYKEGLNYYRMDKFSGKFNNESKN